MQSLLLLGKGDIYMEDEVLLGVVVFSGMEMLLIAANTKSQHEWRIDCSISIVAIHPISPSRLS